MYVFHYVCNTKQGLNFAGTHHYFGHEDSLEIFQEEKLKKKMNFIRSSKDF